MLSDKVKAAFSDLVLGKHQSDRIESRADYAIQSIHLDEASFRLCGLGEKPLIDPVLCMHASLLHRGLGCNKPSFFKFPTTLTFVRNKSLTEFAA